ncbi:helix-turn-helix domain-containing protein [Leptospira stimsonii]|uniref:HTH araC/xylS-type domain-containing protein n=1 Tax=Leptospira stimsonii TaxID=2202203 RepID=A0A396Z2K6_9LEPT|nr:helix-turn-helix domain-containing protein [Leptospira stimsonii]RHX89702.1 hypothetical protein DLM75_12115 [Leptospira stimsonii]
MIFDFDKVIIHLNQLGIYFGFLIGLWKLSRFKKNRMNVFYGITFICIGSLFLYIGGDSVFYLLESDTGIHYDWSLPFYGLIIYSCLMCRSLMRKSISLELRNNDVGINLLFTFTINLVLSFIFRDEVTLKIAGNLISIAITSYTFAEITTSIHTRRFPKKYYQLIVLSLFMTFALALDTIAILKSDLRYHLIPSLIPALLLVYLNLLEIYTTVIADKKTLNSLSTEERLFEREGSATLIQKEGNRKIIDSSNHKGLLKEEQLARIEERLIFFMEEKRFLDEELRLPDLSAFLGISLHHASLYLNQYRKTSFTDFINQKRIEEAKRLILEETNKNLIDIGLACGFNSYSPFHRACIRFTGYSPKDLRNLVLKKEAPKSPLVPEIEQKLRKRKGSVILIQKEGTQKIVDSSNHKGLLKEEQLARIEKRLIFFLEEKRFLDEELRLPDLSAYLGISLHQASLYLNQYRNTSFTDFINQKRIEEAKLLILEEANKNLIDIGLECGFNSYSAFHKACIRFTGYSPKDLRNLVLKKEAPKSPLVPEIGERRTT